MQPAQVYQGPPGQEYGFTTPVDGDLRGHQHGQLRSLRLMVGARPVSVREWEKVLMEASEVIGQVQRY